MRMVVGLDGRRATVHSRIELKTGGWSEWDGVLRKP